MHSEDFYLGDHVEYSGSFHGYGYVKDLSILDEDYVTDNTICIGVEFYEYSKELSGDLHTLQGTIPTRTGWYCEPKNLNIIDEANDVTSVFDIGKLSELLREGVYS